MNKICFVGIDTSNYTTSAAIADEDGKVIANIKRPLPVNNGERGLRQSDAVFSHVKNLPSLMDELSEKLSGYRAVALGVSEKPRDAESSYMPCFLAGVAAAHAFSAGLDVKVPIYGFSHQNGHLMAALYSSGAESLIGEKFLAFHVSGGTTEALLVSPSENTFSVELVGGTNDLNAGQVIDRTGVMMNLHFPCGAEMEKLALGCDNEFPHLATSVKGCFCNLSGIENMTSKLYAETGDMGLVSAATFDCIGRTLSKMSDALREKYGLLPIVYAGGVMSNSIIQNMLSVRKHTYFAKPAFSSDNAAGTSLLCRRKFLGK